MLTILLVCHVRALTLLSMLLLCSEDIFKEIDILCGLNHDNVVYLKEYFEEGNKVRNDSHAFVLFCQVAVDKTHIAMTSDQACGVLTFCCGSPLLSAMSAACQVYLITELVTGGELLEAVLQRGSYSESEARLAFVQLLRGIQYLHSK